MRTAQKKQIEACVELLANAHQTIENAIRKNLWEKVLNLLDHSYQTSTCARTVVATQAGPQEAADAFLEYSNILAGIYEVLTQNGALNVKETTDALEKALKKVKTCVQQIKARREVVFFPYKASMWDSLESVWKAAEEDPDCDAYVVPIPYYDKFPDGTFWNMHYEGDQYPDYVPVTDYREYDFEKRHPDMMFIHNPYDEFNYVTSVYPYYYAKNLKEHTDKLVYIPYFVLAEPESEHLTGDAKEKMKMFCLQPGVLDSHTVIVQSEKMKQVYVNILAEQFGEKSRRKWEQKILGLGSPKLEKAVNTTEEELDIPEDWKPVLYKEDGTKRKVILYNTSVGALLEHDNHMLDKMRDVFRTFCENRDEVALLWRPHPLIKATIESMRPELWQTYERLVNEYKEAGWGIYDDSPDLNRAIALSDAYYGDPSSLTKLCQERGMPVMVQSVNYFFNQ